MAGFSSIVLLAQDDFDLNNGAAAAGAGIMGMFCSLVWLALLVAVIAGVWKVFVKAGKPGWASIIPIYNLVVLLEIAGKPVWWVLLYLIPFVNLIPAIVVPIEVAKRFGKDVLFAIGLIFLPFIFYPLLGFSDAKYR